MRIEMSEAAINHVAGHMADDLEGVRVLLRAVDDLPGTPRPVSSSSLGSPDDRRLRVGRYRVYYEIKNEEIVILRVGRVAEG